MGFSRVLVSNSVQTRFLYVIFYGEKVISVVQTFSMKKLLTAVCSAPPLTPGTLAACLWWSGGTSEGQHDRRSPASRVWASADPSGPWTARDLPCRCRYGRQRYSASIPPRGQTVRQQESEQKNICGKWTKSWGRKQDLSDRGIMRFKMKYCRQVLL